MHNQGQIQTVGLGKALVYYPHFIYVFLLYHFWDLCSLRRFPLVFSVFEWLSADPHPVSPTFTGMHCNFVSVTHGIPGTLFCTSKVSTTILLNSIFPRCYLVRIKSWFEIKPKDKLFCGIELDLHLHGFHQPWIKNTWKNCKNVIFFLVTTPK